MASRRMFAKSIVESGKFLKMPVSAQALYFHLGINADDDGIVDAYPVMSMIKSAEDDLRVLISKGYVRMLNSEMVVVILDWKINNFIRSDRYHPSIYKHLLLEFTENDTHTLGIPSDNQTETNGKPSVGKCSIGKDSVGKDSVSKCSEAKAKDTHIKYKLDDEILSDDEYNELVVNFTKNVVDRVITRILGKPYHGCLNVKKISAWCEEQRLDKKGTETVTSKHSEQLAKLLTERAGK